MIKIYSKYYDNVISSTVLVGDISYEESLNYLLPLVDRFDAQRKVLDAKFYERLHRDINNGCMMPPITLAFVVKQDKNVCKTIEDFEIFVNNSISKGYILDGLQRLNTLRIASKDSTFISSRKLLLNIIIADNEDKLLYRMITLNNGQKPMSPRHQIEILTQNLFDFSLYQNINVQTEKEKALKSQKDSFSFADISKAYLAFITESVTIDNNKFIEEKMDQLLVMKILETNIINVNIEFTQLLNLLNKWMINANVRKWFKNANNLIAFSVGAKYSYDVLQDLNDSDIEINIDVFEHAFEAINTSKVNVGKIRRQLANFYFRNFDRLRNFSEEELTNEFFEETAL